MVGTVVDDDAGIRQLVPVFLEYQGYQASSVANGAETLTHLHGTTPPSTAHSVRFLSSTLPSGALAVGSPVLCEDGGKLLGQDLDLKRLGDTGDTTLTAPRDVPIVHHGLPRAE